MRVWAWRKERGRAAGGLEWVESVTGVGRRHFTPLTSQRSLGARDSLFSSVLPISPRLANIEGRNATLHAVARKSYKRWGYGCDGVGCEDGVLFGSGRVVGCLLKQQRGQWLNLLWARKRRRRQRQRRGSGGGEKKRNNREGPKPSGGGRGGQRQGEGGREEDRGDDSDTDVAHLTHPFIPALHGPSTIARTYSPFGQRCREEMKGREGREEVRRREDSDRADERQRGRRERGERQAVRKGSGGTMGGSSPTSRPPTAPSPREPSRAQLRVPNQRRIHRE